ncbi:MAG TPA: hypothetical protein VJO15_03530 [Dehalococcoidia bacterium]|nr:hypothetical protein [Dehalococcoidia bacterium]
MATGINVPLVRVNVGADGPVRPRGGGAALSLHVLGCRISDGT